MSDKTTKPGQDNTPEDAESVLSLQEQETEDVEAHIIGGSLSSLSAVVGGNC
jgi:hypothetical protein